MRAAIRPTQRPQPGRRLSDVERSSHKGTKTQIPFKDFVSLCLGGNASSLGAGRNEEARAAFNAALVAIESLPPHRRQSRTVTTLQLHARTALKL